jgi:RNA methyltransferase, TrmH family
MKISGEITSLQNSRVKQIGHLRGKRVRLQTGRFVIDDMRDLQRALAAGFTVDYLLYCPQLADQAVVLPELTVFEVSSDVMQKVSYRENPSAIVAVMIAQPPKPLMDLPAIAQPLLVLVDLKKPGNIGALLRTADATGVQAVILADTALDLYNPNIIRASTGACFGDALYAADQIGRAHV